MPIDLDQAESELLAGLLEKELDEIRSEFHHTQGHERIRRKWAPWRRGGAL